MVEVRDGLVRQSSALPPESQWKYSNLAVALAGEIVAAVSGMPYAPLRRATHPGAARMRSTFVDGMTADDARLARGLRTSVSASAQAAAEKWATSGA